MLVIHNFLSDLYFEANLGKKYHSTSQLPLYFVLVLVILLDLQVGAQCP